MKLASRKLFILDPDHRDKNRERRDEKEDKSKTQTQLIQNNHVVESARWISNPVQPHPDARGSSARKPRERKTTRHPSLAGARESIHQHDKHADAAHNQFGQNQSEINIRIRNGNLKR